MLKNGEGEHKAKTAKKGILKHKNNPEDTNQDQEVNTKSDDKGKHQKEDKNQEDENQEDENQKENQKEDKNSSGKEKEPEDGPEISDTELPPALFRC